MDAAPAFQADKDDHLSSRPSQSGSISQLNEDILWNIFLMNADMGEDQHLFPQSFPDYSTRFSLRALTVTRRSSQVCHLWREIIVGTSSIWARLIDWPLLQKLKTDDWKKEIFRRSGEYPLSIKSDEWIRDGPNLKAFTALIDIYWDRIQSLEFGLYYIMTHNAVEDIYQVLSRPAHCLQSLRLYFDDDDGRFSCSKVPTLFSNHAPALRHLILHWANTAFTPQASMFSKLLVLDISYAVDLQVLQVVETLANTPLLEYLAIRECQLIDHENFAFQQEQIRIYLPELCYIRIVDPQFGLCTRIVDAIVPREDCVFNWACAYNKPSGMSFDPLQGIAFHLLLEQNLDKLCKVFRQIAEHYTDSYVVEALDIVLDGCDFAFNDTSDLAFPPTRLPGLDGLSIRITEDLSHEALCSLFDSVSRAYLGDVKRLSLDLLPECLDFREFKFSAFFKRMPFLEHIAFRYWTPDVVSFLYYGAKDLDHDIFPSLKTLTYLYVGPIHPDQTEALLSFLQWRQHMGLPIEALDIRLAGPFANDFRFLERIHGLKVTWRFMCDSDSCEQTYVCGSGDPGMLLMK
ncbi:hypothetical protein CVT26_003221 [Gymnopilus dilepis]|uniref:F-box domain-containing protein n=1 Tax=Gymnopilus dilepis TaxID=231916 RepID=A0A409Y580_9AGAR|nr:hypothetical protein CVT26_003221 [Gymnopilus dilepis]